ncbi:MAG TPA: hypothetical protein PKO15_17040 [Fibrobacteria bacterium]|nr:hypothetical protein [Fibrobacteria bacterium]
MSGLLIASLVVLSSGPNDLTNSGQFEVGTGWNSNPLYLSDSSVRKSGSELFRLRVQNDTKWKSGPLLVRLLGIGDAQTYPFKRQASDDEIRLEPTARLSGSHDLRPWIEIGWLSLLSDNSLLVGSERFDAQGVRQGENRQRAMLEFGVRPKGLGKANMNLAWQRRDFEEVPNATSLDRDQWEAGIAWDGPSWGAATLSVGVDYEDRRYRTWPARYIWGDVAPGVSKHMRSWGGDVGIAWEPVQQWKLVLKPRLLVRQDLAWGYFDEINPSGSISVRWRPDSSWSFHVRIQEGWEYFSHYRDSYNPQRGIKRIRSDNAKFEIARSLGSREIVAAVTVSGEDNSNLRYTWSAACAWLGIRQNY